MIETPAPVLLLPRSLVNRLLHIAQTAVNGSTWGLIGACNATPVHCYPFAHLDVANVIAAQSRLKQQGDNLFALYRTDAGEVQAPDMNGLDTSGISVSLFLDISLGTKGVLQLRGWRIQARQLVPLDMGISEF